MVQIVYFLCAIMSSVCAYLLFKGYQDGKSRLLLWSSLSFFFLAVTNVTLVVDLVILPEVEFSGIIWRNLTGAIAGCLLLFGLIWEVT